MAHKWLIPILIVVGIIVFSSQGLKGGPEVSVREAVALLKGNPLPVLIDVRERAAFDQGHITGARSIPIAEFKQQLESLRLPKADPVIFYDDGGDMRAREATKLLYDSGYQGALTLRGGMEAWRAAGQMVAKP